MSLKKESESTKLLRVRGLGWNQQISHQEYLLGADEQVKNLTAVKKYTKDFQEIYYAEIVSTTVEKTVSTKRVPCE